MRNNHGQTAKDVFYSEHKEFMATAKQLMMDKANYGMLVATIVATIVFAASLVVPAHDVPNAKSLTSQKQWRWFIVFFVANSVALLSSSASIIYFLAVLTSSYTEDEFNLKLPIRLVFGITALFVSITTMVVAFIAASFLIFNHHSTWVAYLVASLGLASIGYSTMTSFASFLYNLLGDVLSSLYWSRYQRSRDLSRDLPFMNYGERLKLHEAVHLMFVEEASKFRNKLAKLCENKCFRENQQAAVP